VHDGLLAESDGELARRIAGARAGGARAEEGELCARFARRVRLYGLRHLRDPQAAADLVQRVLVVTLEKLRAGSVAEPERIGSFVLGVARLLAREMGRIGRREEPLPEGPEGEVASPAEAGPDPAARGRLAGCLEGLGERERTVLLMTYYEERAPAEIAAAVRASEGNVRVIRHRAVARLRDCMGLSAEETA
jgi:RNA polymerase sigma-70 factor, ECF subfamily